LFIHLCDVPSGDALSAIRAEYRAVILREVHATVNDAVVIHLDEVAFADFLIIGDKSFAMTANNF
jgi:hypothetical protein